MYRLYVDEVGTDAMAGFEKLDSRFLSLTGIAMEVDHARDSLVPKFDWIKANIFDHDPDDPIVFHRRKIMQRKGVFGALNNPAKHALFDEAMLRAMKVCEYRVITAIIDKQEASGREKWKEKHPYHYLMQILTEKFSRLLDRVDGYGDIMPEARQGKKDVWLQDAYTAVREHGNFYYSPAQIRHRIPSENLKFRSKKDNIAGLQLADLVAHPSHISMLAERHHAVSLGAFATKVQEILMATKYDRSVNGRVAGYGRKFLP